MQSVIYCNVNLFTYNTTIIIDQNGTQIVYPLPIPTKDLYTLLPSICEKYNIYNIHFCGNEDYISEIINDMQNSLDYSNKNINIEVN